ncbi:MAG TPA: metal-sensitive transcriptional regulator [Actinomycetes bacterium]|jgi:DNA-binding FrmR family transcriptional regulator|nr:metal-sensitive transcriptional regulator [Actinomycetes bacterium]
MRLDDRTVDDVLARLRRVEGQVGGIIRMVESGRDCREVVQQVSAASRALDRTGLRVLAAGLRQCLREQPEPAGDDQAELERLFLRLR